MADISAAVSTEAPVIPTEAAVTAPHAPVSRRVVAPSISERAVQETGARHEGPASEIRVPIPAGAVPSQPAADEILRQRHIGFGNIFRTKLAERIQIIRRFSRLAIELLRLLLAHHQLLAFSQVDRLVILHNFR